VNNFCMAHASLLQWKFWEIAQELGAFI
jgi:hypothetical protein